MPSRSLVVVSLCLLCLAGAAGLSAQTPAPPPLLPEPVVAALAAEVSGTAARRTVQEITLFHRMRGSLDFRAAAELMQDRLRSAGLAGVEILELPADGTIFYGTQRSRPAWDADFAELWEQEGGRDMVRVASWEARPVTLAQDSASGEVAAALVDVGAGTAEADYAGKEVRGKLVLVSAQPSAAYALAVDTHGAAGIVSYAQNQVTAWWKEDETLVRWGHLPSFPPPKTFAFMVSLQQARAWQGRLAAGKAVFLRASVRAGQHPGSYDIATGVIPGADSGRGVEKGDEIVLSCHLDHLRPGANDNASGCAAILEVARTLGRLVQQKRLPPPARTIRFIFPPEIEGTIALLNAKPELARRTKAAIHLDMVGGDAEITKAVFHVTRSPKSLPTFVNDVGEAFGRFLNEQSYAYAATGAAPYPLVDPEGSKRALQAEVVDFTEGSDHQVWTEGSFRVPALYLNDWPDRSIHTHADELSHIDATKLRRAAFLAAASAWYLADLDSGGVPDLWKEIRRHALERTATALGRSDRLRATGDAEAAAHLLRVHLAYEAGVVASIAAFAEIPAAVQKEAEDFLAGLRRQVGVGELLAVALPGNQTVVYRRAPEPKGPMNGFGYSYFDDKLAALRLERPALLSHQGLWGGGSDYAYEALNLVDGRRTVREVHDDLAAIYGPVPVELVREYLAVLARIGVVVRP
jgi:aminopeptidase YwaD